MTKIHFSTSIYSYNCIRVEVKKKLTKKRIVQMFVPFISLLENGEIFRVWWFWRTQKTIKLTFKRNRRMSPTRFIEERTVFIATFGVLMRKCTSSKGIQFSIFTSYGPLLSRSFHGIVYSCALKFILIEKNFSTLWVYAWVWKLRKRHNCPFLDRTCTPFQMETYYCPLRRESSPWLNSALAQPKTMETSENHFLTYGKDKTNKK